MLSYVHIPFCHRVCPYCSFYKHTPGATSIGEFLEALLREGAREVEKLREKPRTLYLGGGTPTMLSPQHLRRLFGGLREILDFGKLDEISLEANPATFDAKKAALFVELGVTRASLGIQSFEGHVLETLGREHTPEQAEASVGILREAGMGQVNVDLMFSIPGQSLEDWKRTLARAIALEPDHVSAYNLTYEEDTAFFDSLQRGEMDRDEDRDATFYHVAHEMLTEAGFLHYETSNYAKPGKESVHNRGYWLGEDYLGLGPSAVSTLERVRYQNVEDTAKYVAMMDGVGNARVRAEELGERAWRIERIALGLRTLGGISREWLEEEGLGRAEILVGQGLARWQGGQLVLTEEGAPLVDEVAAELI